MSHHGFDVDDFTHVLDNITSKDWDLGFQEDPYYHKANDGDGSRDYTITNLWQLPYEDYYQPLNLTLYNALDGHWQVEFYTAVQDWNKTDALNLNTDTINVDYECSPVYGVMKVCNGNYGDSGWLGINEIEIECPYYSIYDTGSNNGGDCGSGQIGTILSSVAKIDRKSVV